MISGTPQLGRDRERSHLGERQEATRRALGGFSVVVLPAKEVSGVSPKREASEDGALLQEARAVERCVTIDALRASDGLTPGPLYSGDCLVLGLRLQSPTP
jgi:hypothetical protein